jgi:hypothetical protein
MIRHFAFFCLIFASLCCGSFGQAATVIQANEAASHVKEWATVEGVVVKVFTSKIGNTFLNFGAAYPNQTFTFDNASKMLKIKWPEFVGAVTARFEPVGIPWHELPLRS